MRARLAPTVYARVTASRPGSGAAIVQTGAQHWNKKLAKKFTHPKKLHVSDPSHAVRVGDTVAVARWPSLGTSKRITHTVTQILAPWGRDGAAQLSQRPAVWTEEQRREWRHNRLLERGTPLTQHGLRSGALYIGEEGKIMQRVKDAESLNTSRPISDAAAHGNAGDSLREVKQSVVA